MMQPTVWPLRGTPERAALDLQERDRIRALAPSMQRPVSWTNMAAAPVDGDWCCCCKSQRFWCEAKDPKGWRCATCHPASGRQEVRIVSTAPRAD